MTTGPTARIDWRAHYVRTGALVLSDLDTGRLVSFPAVDWVATCDCNPLRVVEPVERPACACGAPLTMRTTAVERHQRLALAAGRREAV